MKILISKLKFILIASTIFMLSCSDDDNNYINIDDTIVIEDSKPSEAINPNGFYILNEDWFGHDNGTVNYFKNDGSIVYRAYRANNNGEQLGVTSVFGTFYGDNIYFVSKQENRLVVADSKTLKKKAVFAEIGGDGRSFVGVNPSKGYIATNKGISIFDIESMTIGKTIPEINNEVGNMCLAGKYVFAIDKVKGVHVINSETDEIETLINGSMGMLTQSKDGNIWISANKKLICVDPYTLKQSEVDITDTPISGTWFAWNPGSLCASTKENTLYWTKGNSVVKYDIDKKELNTAFYTLGKDEEGKQLAFYGAALRVDPLTDKLVIIVKRSGWGDAGSYNWVHIVNNTGALEKSIIVGDQKKEGETEEKHYYWFPSMPLFQDVNAPEILLNQIVLEPNQRKAVYLNDKIIDADNTSASIIKSVLLKDKDNELIKYEMKGDSLIVTSGSVTGKALLTIKANSNGKLVEKDIRIDVRN